MGLLIMVGAIIFGFNAGFSALVDIAIFVGLILAIRSDRRAKGSYSGGSYSNGYEVSLSNEGYSASVVTI